MLVSGNHESIKMKLFLVISFLFPGCLTAQKKWYAISKNDGGMMIAQALAGSADAINQGIQFGKIGKNQFWDYSRSWKNKYRDYDAGDTRAAFPLSKTMLVFATDGYHLTRMMSRNFVLFSFTIGFEDLSKYERRDRWKVIVKKTILSSIANRIAFNIIYK